MPSSFICRHIVAVSTLAFLLPVSATAQTVGAYRAGPGAGPVSTGTYTASVSAGIPVAGIAGTGPTVRSGFWYATLRSTSLACAAAWSLDLTGTDAASTVQDLTIGQSTVATGGLDSNCGESELPPPPVEGFSDFRFVDTNLSNVSLGEGSRIDVRPKNTATGASGGGSPPSSSVAPATWRMSVASESYPITVSWNAAELQSALPNTPVQLVDVQTDGRLVAVNMKQKGSVRIENSGITALWVLVNQRMTRTISLQDGWNLKSIPLRAPDMSFQALLSSSCTSGFVYESGQGYISLDPGDTLAPGEGGFFKCTSGGVPISGMIPQSVGPTVESGWNIAGPFASEASVSAVAPSNGQIESAFYGLTASTGYTEAGTLAPTEGYWVKTSDAGVLDLSGNGTQKNGRVVAKRSPTGAPQAASSGSSEFSLVVTDATGKRATLRVASEGGQQSASALPPKPPSDLFDVRFAAGTRTAVLGAGTSSSGTGARTVELQGTAFPVRLHLQGSPGTGDLVDVRVPRAKNRSLSRDEPTAVLRTETDRFQIEIANAPQQLALKESRPNPARDRATIEYALPTAGHVDITIYDVLGRQVARLVDGRRRAGVHRAAVDVAGLSSGTYIVHLEAGGQRKSRRMSVVH